MLRTYLKIIVRSLGRNKTFSLINLLGLTIGLTSFIMIGLYVFDEFSFDRFHEKTERIYQVTVNANFDGRVSKWNAVPNQVAPTFSKEIPEVEKAARILPNNFTGKAFVASENLKSSENRLVWADNEIFEIFTFQFLKGNPATALTRPHTVVITEASALKYFGSLDVIGKSLKIERDTADFEITGLIANPRSNSRIQYPVIASFVGTWGDKSLSWGNASFETYLLLHENTDPKIVEEKIAASIEQNVPKDNRWFALEIHPLKDIHLQYADVAENNGAVKGDLNQLNVLIGLGIIILLVAAVNYMNLSTAQSQRRFKEIGISKTLGASSTQLARKFYLETAFFVGLSIVVSFMLVTLITPIFDAITGKHLDTSFFQNGWFWILFFAIWIILTLLAGFYPAIYLSSFSPKQVLKGSLAGLGGNSSLRKGLVIVQFSISITLIISTLILHRQLSFIREKNLGYEPEQVIALETTGAQNRQQVMALKNSLQDLSFVTSVARSQSYPGMSASGRTIHLPDDPGGSGKSITTVRATPEILSALGIKLLAGKTLPEKSDADTTVQVILNKTAVDFLGLSPEEAIGRTVEADLQSKSEIVGVMEDFHFTSLREPIGAYCFHNAKTEGFNVLLVKVSTNDLPGAIRSIENEFKKVIPTAFQFTFLDQHMQGLYLAEQQLGQVVFIFASLAIFVACLGLYALAAYTTEQRTKEIGVRKVMGASVVELVNMLSKDFLKLVIISFFLAIPVAYYVMSQWLEGFAYRIDIPLLVFAISGVASVAIAWITVGYESLKAAKSSPVNSLRNE